MQQVGTFLLLCQIEIIIKLLSFYLASFLYISAVNSFTHLLLHCATGAAHSLFVNSDSFDKCHQHKRRVVMRARERELSDTWTENNRTAFPPPSRSPLPSSSFCCVSAIIEGSFALCVSERHWKLTCDAI